MNLFQIDFLGKMATLLKEAFKFKKYRAMNPALAVFTGIFMLPLVAISFVITAILAVLCFAFAVLSAPVKYLHGIVNNEGKEVKHATQAIVYLISWPMVFALYLAMSALLVAILPVYAALSIVLYAWTLGGFKFHLFPHTQEDISVEVTRRYLVLPLLFVIACALIYIGATVHGAYAYYRLWKVYLEKFFGFVFFGPAGIFWTYVGGHTAFAFLFSLIGFNCKKKAPSVEEPEAIEEATFVFDEI